MTDTKQDTQFDEHGGRTFETEYNEYAIQPTDGSICVVRIDRDNYLFERVGSICCERSEIVLKKYLSEDSLGDTGSYEEIESVSTEIDDFESQLQKKIFELIQDGKVSEEKAQKFADDLAESFTEQVG